MLHTIRASSPDESHILQLIVGRAAAGVVQPSDISVFEGAAVGGLKTVAVEVIVDCREVIDSTACRREVVAGRGEAADVDDTPTGIDRDAVALLRRSAAEVRAVEQGAASRVQFGDISVLDQMVVIAAADIGVAAEADEGLVGAPGHGHVGRLAGADEIDLAGGVDRDAVCGVHERLGAVRAAAANDIFVDDTPGRV